ncbi:MAG: hypothetical protein KME23_08080 [Goleter apudmare HA4340-LM2]|jgi:hypothetical protein|nr:hypothetical protein [Goleter apudmare HA4340-LM2]
METIQLTLNYLLEIVVLGFFSFLVVDFVNTAFASCTKAYVVAQIQQLDPSLVPELLATTTPSVTPPEIEPKPTTPVATPIVATPEPNPWDLATDIQPTPILPQPVVLPFSTLKLLPPATEVQPKSKATKEKSTSKLKSTTPKETAKLSNKATTQTRSKSRKSAA